MIITNLKFLKLHNSFIRKFLSVFLISFSLNVYSQEKHQIDEKVFENIVYENLQNKRPKYFGILSHLELKFSGKSVNPSDVEKIISEVKTKEFTIDCFYDKQFNSIIIISNKEKFTRDEVMSVSKEVIYKNNISLITFYETFYN